MQIVSLVLLAVALAIVVAMVSNKDTYRTFEQARRLPEGKVTTIVGELMTSKPIEFNPEINPNLTVFYVRDKEGNEMKVRYSEPKPVDFERSEQVTVTGKVVGDAFHADKVLVKCPSKYVDEGISEATANAQ